MPVRACVFDAYGTLFDVHSVVPLELREFSQVWRQKQVEYTWRRALMRRYVDFWSVTEEALRAAARQLGVHVEAERLMQAYLSPKAFEEVSGALEALKPRPLAILSNGSPKMLEGAVRFNKLEGRFAHVLSVDAMKTYKPAPEVYAMGPEALGIPAQETLFVSSNAWEAAGAKAFGYQVCWCNRTGEAGDGLFLDPGGGFQPDHVATRLDEIAKLAG